MARAAGNAARFAVFAAAAAICLLRPAYSLAEAAGGAKRPNIVLIVVDTLGAKHLGVYDRTLTHTPNISRLAGQGTVFERAVSVAPWTKPAVASILTGKYPSRHGVRRLKSLLTDEQETLPEILKRAGYATQGYVSHTLITGKYGYDQGFDGYGIVQLDRGVHQAISSDVVTRDSAAWIKKRDRSKPFFLFAHYFDPHYDYQHHEEFDQTSWYKGELKPGVGFSRLRRTFPTLTADDRKFLVGLYREEIAFVDRYVGALLEVLGAEGIEKDTIVVFTADHGEEFGEHGKIGHTRTLYNELVHVPLIVRYPGRVGSARISEPVSTADVTPTILALAGVPLASPEELDGKALFSGGGKPSVERRPVFSEVDYPTPREHLLKTSVVDGDLKMIRDHRSGKAEMYDWSSDYGESKPLSTDPSGPAGKLGAALDGHHTAPHREQQPEAPELEISNEEVKALKSLGYL